GHEIAVVNPGKHVVRRSAESAAVLVVVKSKQGLDVSGHSALIGRQFRATPPSSSSAARGSSEGAHRSKVVIAVPDAANSDQSGDRNIVGYKEVNRFCALIEIDSNRVCYRGAEIPLILVVRCEHALLCAPTDDLPKTIGMIGARLVE